ncbi:hypothetical protein [Terrimonas ferruginea]|uniref:hypothetical protein n=1 Tax=Terrimonas ferruginea TaxID=249 RepID=UPI00048DCECC|nr:hypothetical protein [Terrimonas ferruginea]
MMKRLPLCLTVVFLLIFTISAHSADIYVSPAGADNQDGTISRPLATVNAALRMAREWRRLNDPRIQGGIRIVVKGGNYFLNEPVFIRPEDTGTADSPTTIEAAPGETPVISGGRNITGWKKAGSVPGLPAAAKGKVWVADVPLDGGRPAEFRQLWINGQKAVRARDRNADSMSRILSWNKADQTCRIPWPAIKGLTNAPSLEMVIHQWWAIAILRVKEIRVQGDSAQLFFHQPESRIQSEHPWPAPWISKETGNSAFFLANAVQLLDQPGEWFLDIGAAKVYYWPRNGEDLSAASVIAPYHETLLRLEGTIDHPVKYVNIKGLRFQHTGWLRPSRQGHVPHQAGLYMLDAYKLKVPGTPDKKSLENQAWVGRPAAAVDIRFAHNIGIENCLFEHLASTALDFGKGTQQSMIRGNLFDDIGGTAILAGVFSEEPVEVHLPYDPTDQREWCRAIEITNNLITNATNEDWGCVGIGAGFVRDILIAHNELAELSYTGISVGWGWTRTLNVMRNNRILSNKIHHYGKHMYDVAAIYTLSAQPGSVISGNYIDSIYEAPYAHLPDHWFYLYTDEGSSFFNVKDNWTPAEKYLQNANGPGNIWTNNGPAVKDSIRQQAGLEPAYRHLLEGRKTADKNWPINQEKK